MLEKTCKNYNKKSYFIFSSIFKFQYEENIKSSFILIQVTVNDLKFHTLYISCSWKRVLRKNVYAKDVNALIV
jgi:hypothetical protein